MKRSFFLPFTSPRFICYDHLVCANAIITANAKEKASILMCSKYINCYYKENSINHKFVISMFDHWCTTQKIMHNQSINLLKEVYCRQNIEILLLIKKFIYSRNYVLGQCNRVYIESNCNENSPFFNYVISAYDDNAHTFLIHGLNSSKEFISINIDYNQFVDSLFDTIKPSISFSLWQYSDDANIVFDYQNIVFELEDFLNSTNRRIQYTEDKIYGLSAIKKLAQYLFTTGTQNNYLETFYLNKLLAHKNYMRQRMECLSKHNIITNESLLPSKIVESSIKSICDDANRFNSNKDSSTLTNIVANINHTVTLERNYLTSVLTQLKNHIDNNN